MAVVHSGEQVMFNLIIESAGEVVAEVTVDTKVLGGNNLVFVKIGIRRVGAVVDQVIDLRVYHKEQAEDYPRKRCPD